MAHRRIGEEQFGFAVSRGCCSSLDDLSRLIDWHPITALLKAIHASAKGEAAWPPLAMFKALLLSVWYDLSDVKLAEALDDRASFRRFYGFSKTEPTPERTAFVRFRKALMATKLDRALFEEVSAQLKAKAVRVKTGTIVDATIIRSASEGDDDARWVKHKRRPAVHGFKAHVGADADTALIEEVAVTPPTATTAEPDRRRCPRRPAKYSPTVPICWGLHLSALRLALIGRFGLRLGETIQAAWLTLGDPGLMLCETGLRSSAPAHA